MQHAPQVTATLGKLKAMGIKLAIDDFGTGHSSLSHLKRFPLDTLKIDRSFIKDVIMDVDAALITKAVISMAGSLRLRVVAEGVESQAQLAFLASCGCDEIQGYYFSPPVSADDCTRMIRDQRKLALPASGANDEGRTLLLVDDETRILSALKRVLRRDGYRILTAGSAAEGLELLACNKIAVVVTDQRMPEMAGVEFLQRVKDLYPDVVRIMLSGYTDFHSITDAINRGAVYKFLTKPWDDQQLRDNIGEAFRRYEPATQSGRQSRDVRMIDPEAHNLPSTPSRLAADLARAD
jgi:CheY-like chemotaxis protein